MEKLKILQKIEDLIEASNPYITKMPKSQRFILAGRIENTLHQLYQLAIALQYKFYKKTTIQEMIINLESLQGYIRFACKLKFISSNAYGVWSGRVVEVNKMTWAYNNYLKEVQKSKTNKENQ